VTTVTGQEVTTPYLVTLRAVLDAERPSTARNYGAARLDVMRLLVARLARGAVQAMLMGGSLTDEERIEFAHHGVIWWGEGGHAAELDLRDTGWGAPDRLQKIVDFHRGASPRIYVLADEATKVDLPDAYAWERRGPCMVGINKDPRPAFWQEVEDLRHRRIDITRTRLRCRGYSVPDDPPDTHSGSGGEDSIAPGSKQVTSPLWDRLDAKERERRERGATLMKHGLSKIPFYADRAEKCGGDKYWADHFDASEE